MHVGYWRDMQDAGTRGMKETPVVAHTSRIAQSFESTRPAFRIGLSWPLAEDRRALQNSLTKTHSVFRNLKDCRSYKSETASF